MAESSYMLNCMADDTIISTLSYMYYFWTVAILGTSIEGAKTVKVKPELWSLCIRVLPLWGRFK